MAIDLEKYRKRLLNERARLEADRANIRGPGGSDQDQVADLSDYDPNHPGDRGSETFQRTKDMALRANLDAQLNMIQGALARIDAGTYGTCERCGKPIPVARLDAVPYATLCIEDQEHIENAQ